MNESTMAGRDAGAPTMHVSLDTADLSRAVDFYTRLFGVAPAKRRADWAKFELTQPRLVFSLNAVPVARPAGRLSHLGIRVGSHDALAAIRDRLTRAGVAIREEPQANCCYALQDKLWAEDPDGNAFEFYVLVADVDATSAGMDAAEQRPDSMASCCVPAKATASATTAKSCC